MRSAGKQIVLFVSWCLAIRALAAPGFADQVYFIVEGTGPAIVPQNAPVAIDRTTGKPIGPPQEVVVPLALDTIGTTTNHGDGFTVVMQSGDKEKERICSVSPSPDGSMLLCHEVISATKGQFTSRLLILKPGGEVTKTIDLAAKGIRVFGAPVFLPDGKHIGLTIGDAKAAPAAAAPVRTNAPPRRPARGPEPDSNFSGQLLWTAARFSGQPTIATMDLDGQNLRRIGPGAMPAWSPDGKTILYTELKLAGAHQINTCRLYAMNADGKNAHPVAPDMTCDGSFSPDGKQIVYVGSFTSTAPSSTRLFVADADGAHAERVALENYVFSAPRWIETDLIIAVGGGQVFSYDLKQHKRYRLSPTAVDRHPALNGAGLDIHATALINELSRNPHGSLGSSGPAGSPAEGSDPNQRVIVYKPVPAGYTVQFRGTEVYLLDTRGTLTPMPDGEYQLPDGRKIRVRAAHQIIISN